MIETKKILEIGKLLEKKKLNKSNIEKKIKKITKIALKLMEKILDTIKKILLILRPNDKKIINNFIQLITNKEPKELDLIIKYLFYKVLSKMNLAVNDKMELAVNDKMEFHELLNELLNKISKIKNLDVDSIKITKLIVFFQELKKTV
jgi:hypothetical protein